MKRLSFLVLKKEFSHNSLILLILLTLTCLSNARAGQVTRGEAKG